mmetsp:Transcript_10931/g.23357  ORF Transcript_10931/g.23357 Transcript_10931/m.23357 type:complete len:283 (-) Transcript_10931:6-854(-)
MQHRRRAQPFIPRVLFLRTTPPPAAALLASRAHCALAQHILKRRLHLPQQRHRFLRRLRRHLIPNLPPRHPLALLQLHPRLLKLLPAQQPARQHHALQHITIRLLVRLGPEPRLHLFKLRRSHRGFQPARHVIHRQAAQRLNRAHHRHFLASARLPVRLQRLRDALLQRLRQLLQRNVARRQQLHRPRKPRAARVVLRKPAPREKPLADAAVHRLRVAHKPHAQRCRKRAVNITAAAAVVRGGVRRQARETGHAHCLLFLELRVRVHQRRRLARSTRRRRHS